jgi:hypothetical protein
LRGHVRRANAPRLSRGTSSHFQDHSTDAANCHIPRRDHKSLGPTTQPRWLIVG